MFILSAVTTLNAWFLTTKLKNDMIKFRKIYDLLKEETRLSCLVKEFEYGIDWEKIKY